MNSLIQLKTITSPLLITLTLLCFGLFPKAQAVVPPPDGGYPNFTTAEGQNALKNLTTGSANTAVGWFSLFSDTTGSFNTATGAGSLLFNTADSNTAFGAAVLLLNTTGSANTAVGVDALLNNSAGENNTVIGAFALLSNTDGANNTANGESALRNNTGGSANTAAGDGALFSNTIADNSTATGFQALVLNTEGDNNTANGTNTLFHNTTGSGNVALGFRAGFNLTTGDNNIDIGNEGLAGDSDTIRIGNASHNRILIPAINNIVLGAGLAVTIDSTTGLLGTAASSQRFKKDIATMEKASEAILSLRPVTFHYKTDEKDTPQFGLIAEEVAKVNPALVLPDKEGKPYTVRYDQVNAMLLNEFLKEHHKVHELEANAAQQQRNFTEQQKQIEALTAGLQKVSAQLEVSKSAPQTVLNRQ